MRCKLLELSPRFEIPHLECAVIARCNRAFSVRRDDNVVDAVVMRIDLMQQFAGRRVPDAERTFGACSARDDETAIRSESDAPQMVRRSDFADDFVSAEVDQSDFCFGFDGGQCFAIGRDVKVRMVGAGQTLELLARFRIPEADRAVGASSRDGNTDKLTLLYGIGNCPHARGVTCKTLHFLESEGCWFVVLTSSS